MAKQAKPINCPWSGEPVEIVQLGDSWLARVPGKWATKLYPDAASLRASLRRRSKRWEGWTREPGSDILCPFTGKPLGEYLFHEGLVSWAVRGSFWYTEYFGTKDKLGQFLFGVDGEFPQLPTVTVVDKEPPFRDIIREEAEERLKAVDNAIEEASDLGLLDSSPHGE